MEFINRNEELKRLNTLITSPQGVLGVLWGRRRIGKTRLLLEWSMKNKGLPESFHIIDAHPVVVCLK